MGNVANAAGGARVGRQGTGLRQSRTRVGVEGPAMPCSSGRCHAHVFIYFDVRT